MATPPHTKITGSNNNNTAKENPNHETASSHGAATTTTAAGSPLDSSTGDFPQTTAIALPQLSNNPISETFKLPSYSRWFSWEGIHGTERRFLPEFFDGKLEAKNPRVYKDYRDSIMGKYRENPQRKITFTEARRMVVGDVNTVRRVFDFLESWGLVNYQATPPPKQQSNSKAVAGTVGEGNNSVGNGNISGENVGNGKAAKGLAAAAADGKASTLIDGKRGLVSSDGKGSKEKRGVFCNGCGAECSRLHYDCLKEVIKPMLEDEIPPEEPGSSATNDGIAEGLKASEQDPEKESSPKAMEVEPNNEKNSMEAERNENKEVVVKKPDKLLRCPRCDSSGTKFCYYNNYNVNQPRYFCKNCQRYWTAGGTMRNVPVGAGRRKNRHSGSYLPSAKSGDAAYGQAGYVLCAKCYVTRNYGPGLAAEDFKRVEIKEEEYRGVEWTNQEMLLLLEAIMVFNDDWKHVAQHVGTKSEAECVTKFVQLPFGEQYMGNDGKEESDRGSSNNNIERIEHDSSQKAAGMQHQDYANFDEKHYTDDDIPGPPLKRRHLTPLSDASNPIMAQVAFLSTMAGSRIAEAAAKAAVAALCDDDLCGSQIGGSQESKFSNKKEGNRAKIAEESEKDFQMEDGKEECHGVSDQTTKDGEPLSCLKESTMMMKGQAVTATVMESAAVRAKLLLDQEEQDTEQLFSTIIDTQMKKLQEKIQNFDEMEVIMENEHSQVEQIKNLLYADRLQFLNEAMKLRLLGNQGKEIDGT